jgi:hypothetical protein
MLVGLKRTVTPGHGPCSSVYAGLCCRRRKNTAAGAGQLTGVSLS